MVKYIFPVVSLLGGILPFSDLEKKKWILSRLFFPGFYFPILLHFYPSKPLVKFEKCRLSGSFLEITSGKKGKLLLVVEKQMSKTWAKFFPAFFNFPSSKAIRGDFALVCLREKKVNFFPGQIAFPSSKPIRGGVSVFDL